MELIKRTFHETTESTECDLNDIIESLNSLYNKSNKFLYHDDLYSLNYLSSRRWLLAQPYTGVKLVLRNLIIDAMMSCEAYNKGSEIWFPYFLYHDINDSIYSGLKSSSEYVDLCCKLSKNEKVVEIFKELISLSGPMTKLRIKTYRGNDVAIRYRNAYQFPIKIDSRFHQMLGHVENIEMSNPIIIMIEGAPETVGEIHNLLQENHKDKNNIVLIARSYPEEISATLATNWKRKSLNILPLVYGDSIETINLAADLSVITGGQLITSQMGDRITLEIMNPKKRGLVQRIEWNNNKLSLYKEDNKLVQSHLSSLYMRLSEASSEDLQNIYSDRIQCLSNDSLELMIPEYEEILLDELDMLLKHYNAYIRSGVLEINGLTIPWSFRDGLKDIVNSFKNEIKKIAGFLMVSEEVYK